MSSIADILVTALNDVFALLPFLVGGGLILMYILSLSNDYDLKGKHVFITGGSSGIGIETAKEYLNRGANITIAARNQERLNEAVKVLEIYDSSTTKEHRKIVSISVDVSSSQDNVNMAVDAAVKAHGRTVDVLVNCAGTSVAGAFDTTSTDEFQNLFRSNVMGSVYPTRAVVQGMKEKKSGRVIFVASQVAQAAIHGYTAYASSKWALRGLAEALQMELKPYHVLVSVCYPPDTDTPGYEKEMLSKPALTKKLSESGSVFKSSDVARDLVTYSGRGYFGISTGLDGWLLKQLHAGMTPANCMWEVVQQILFSSIARYS